MQRMLAATDERERDVIREFAVIDLPVGVAMQAAAVRSLGYLGETYEQLREAALDALDYLEVEDVLRRTRDDAITAVGRASDREGQRTRSSWRSSRR